MAKWSLWHPGWGVRVPGVSNRRIEENFGPLSERVPEGIGGRKWVSELLAG
jgi:hypothetical protein